MKKILFLSLFISFNMFGQSVTISPSTLGRNGGTSNDIQMIKNSDGFASINGYRSGGSTASRTSTPNGMILMQIGGGGYTGSQFFLGGIISFKATETWDSGLSGTKMTFNTTKNGNNFISEKMVINHDGKVGIGVSTPNEILDVNGRMRLRHTEINNIPYSSGVWMNNSFNSLNYLDGAFHGMKTDTETGIFIGGYWRFWVKSNGNVVNTGFTQLGDNVPAGASPGATAPAIKTLKLTGTTAGAAGASISVDHGLGNRLKILGYTVLVVGTSAVSYPPEYTYNGGYQYSTTCTNTQILIINSHLNSANIYNKAFTVLITYEE